MRRVLVILGVAAAAAIAVLALRGPGPEISGDPTAVGEPEATSRADTRGDSTPAIRESGSSAASPQRPLEASALAAPPRSEPPPEPYPPSIAARADEHVLGAWMGQDDALALKGLPVPPRTYRGFTPAKPTMAAILMLCDLHPDSLNRPCVADTDLMERVAEGADSTTGLWAPNSENLLRDFFEEHGPLTVEQVICSDTGCIVDGLAPSRKKVPWEESEAADLGAIAKLRAEPWYQLYFESDGRPAWAPDPETGGYERIIVLKRRTTP